MVGLVNRLLAAIAASVLVGLAGATAGWAAAPTSVGPASDASAQQTAALGAGFATPLTVVVRDAANAPVAAVSVHFQGPVSGAGATLSATDAVTDVNGVASVTATANATGGFELGPRDGDRGDGAGSVHPAEPASPGFSPGEQLADVQAPDHAGVGHTLREFLENGQSFLLVYVCTAWCGPCQAVADQAPAAIAQLAALGIKLRTSSRCCSKARPTSPARRATPPHGARGSGSSIRSYTPAAAPRRSRTPPPRCSAQLPRRRLPDVLVAPNGTIIDRKVGADQITQQSIVDRVLDASDPSVHQAQSVGLTLTRGAETISGTAAPELQAPFGTARVEPSLRLSQAREQFAFHFDATSAFHLAPTDCTSRSRRTGMTAIRERSAAPTCS